VADQQISLAERIDKISADIMSASLTDLRCLGIICGDLEAITAELPDSRQALGQLTASLTGAVEAVILDEHGDLDDPIDVLARGIAMLQRLQTDYERTQKEEIDDRELCSRR